MSLMEEIGSLCRRALGSPVGELLFREASVGDVFGVRLADGRRVVVKVHQPREAPETLSAIVDVQAHHHRAGFPCPEPLAGPLAVGCRQATFEAYVDEGEHADTHDPRRRTLIARALAQHLVLARECTAEWIDALAARAKPIATRVAPRVLGHHDWSGKHFRFADDRITVVYDWDSVRLGTEAVIVGNAACSFTANFDLPEVDPAPAPDEVRAFVDDYDAARPTPLSRAEREQIAACGLYLLAYVACCEHARADRDGPFTRALRRYGERYLVP